MISLFLNVQKFLQIQEKKLKFEQNYVQNFILHFILNYLK
jgi:hypothetical protein